MKTDDNRLDFFLSVLKKIINDYLQTTCGRPTMTMMLVLEDFIAAALSAKPPELHPFIESFRSLQLYIN
jgi:hypothetical protein